MSIQVVILAAGQGKRMQSQWPKVLQPLAGKPLLAHVLQTASTLTPTAPIVVYGHQGKLLREQFATANIQWVEQAEQKGTGHAVAQALPQMADQDNVLILCGDVPLISATTLTTLITTTPAKALGMLTATLAQPTGYGRIVRDQQKRISGVVEEKDATEIQRALQEINPGIYFVPARYLKKWLPQLTNQNAQGEYYFTDIIALATKDTVPVHGVAVTVPEEIMGVNDRVQLAHLERFYQRQQAEKLMRAGATLADPARVDIRGEVTVGRDVFIDVNVILAGIVEIGEGCVLGPHTVLRDVKVGSRVEIKANSVIEEATIAADCIVGPFARVRPGTMLAEKVHVGNFVEIKNSTVGTASKINHLSYIGDSIIGKQVNIGAGTITCNYDGANKHKTVIEDGVHIGSDTQLVAPVTVGAGATIAAGSTLTKDAPAHQLTLTHKLEQRSKTWQRPLKDVSKI